MTERAEYEPTPERAVADYEGYRKVVDTLSPAFRKVGIVDEAGYDRALRDPRTVRLSIGRVELPLFAPAEYVSGYDVPRSSRLTGQEQVFVLATPMSALTGPDVKVLGGDSEFDPANSAIIVETDHAETADTQAVLPDALTDAGRFQAREFLDERIRNPNQQAASMSTYKTRLAALDESGEVISRRSTNFLGAYREMVTEEYPLAQHTHLLDVNELRHNEQLVDELWDICKDRFEWLGDAHPVSMEDTKDFFVQLVSDENTHTIVRYDDEGRPACMGFFISGLEGCEWFSDKYRHEATAEAEQNGDHLLYFHGIASRGDSASYYARDVMQLLSRINHQMGGTYTIIFESTNMSSRYIPRMVDQYVHQGDGLTTIEPTAKTAQLDYWYLAPATVD